MTRITLFFFLAFSNLLLGNCNLDSLKKQRINFKTLFFDETNSKSGIGMSINFSPSNIIQINLEYKRKRNNFIIGFVSENGSGKNGPAKSSRLSNYGLQTNGSGKYLSGFKIGYDFQIIKFFYLGTDIYIVKNYYFTNYIDNRFKAKGYHLIDESIKNNGIGITAKFITKKGFGLNTGWNNLFGINFGVNQHLIFN